MFFSRNHAVAALAALMLVFTGWAWGGVVLWTQFVTCALGAIALIIALTPSSRSSAQLASPRRDFSLALVIGFFVAAGFVTYDGYHLLDQRSSTLQLIPDAVLPEMRFSDWGLRGGLAGFGSMLLSLLALGLRTPTHARSLLLRFPPFWIGVALFGFISIQSLNPWGVVVERDLTWKIIQQDYISWIPAGLAAPFVGDDDPGGMNGWRQMLILSGPWMLLCALRIAVTHRRTYAHLAWIVGLNSMAVGVVGAVVAAGKDLTFLGFKNWFAYKAPFGPFIYKNHAGIYLYLSAAIVLALTAHLIARRGDRADRGGPHLIAAILFVMLCLASASTLSVGAFFGVGALLLLAPALYFVDRHVSAALSPAPALMLLGLASLVIYVAGSSSKMDILRERVEKKRAYVEQAGSDDRGPIRRATLSQITDGDTSRLAFGWGAGSYRWTSPVYMVNQPEFVDSKGRLWARANYAHCDWLQALLEWGVVGCFILFPVLAWLWIKILHAIHRRSASQLALSAALVLVLAHAALDFIFYFTPTLTLLALIVAWLASAEDPADSRLGY
jgi:hypothetical protein